MKQKQIETKPVPPPAPFGPVPSTRQRKWHALEFYGFLHFTVNTFTDKEWGYGDESPAVFNPTDFDADQIVGAAQQAGMQGLILTCKHHDGFCLWPSRFTEHSVKNSPWRKGKGDVVGEIAEACRQHGLRFGTYLSPWDRHHAAYGRPEYVTYYRDQLRELLTEYGPVFEVWFDGANGGDGYYGGARETRTIDKLTYYGWPETWKLVRELQPDACMFSDAGPDVRWVGNEAGTAGDPCWSAINADDFAPGSADIPRQNTGARPGSRWLPAECDVSIRPGWFWHEAENDKVRTPENLLDLYFRSVGRGASFLLNLPPDRRGRIHEADVEALRGLRQRLDRLLARDLARGARASASHVRGGAALYDAACAVDGRSDTYWCTDDEVRQPELVLEFPAPVTFGVTGLREFLPLGQRVDRFALDAWQGGGWMEVASAAAIGHRRLLRHAPVTTDRVRLRITAASACPAIAEVALYPGE
jgi:alpha-L-fucosidase